MPTLVRLRVWVCVGGLCMCVCEGVGVSEESMHADSTYMYPNLIVYSCPGYNNIMCSLSQYEFS